MSSQLCELVRLYKADKKQSGHLNLVQDSLISYGVLCVSSRFHTVASYVSSYDPYRTLELKASGQCTEADKKRLAPSLVATNFEIDSNDDFQLFRTLPANRFQCLHTNKS